MIVSDDGLSGFELIGDFFTFAEKTREITRCAEAGAAAVIMNRAKDMAKKRAMKAILQL